jgi:hypothetical protein
MVDLDPGLLLIPFKGVAGVFPGSPRPSTLARTGSRSRSRSRSTLYVLPCSSSPALRVWMRVGDLDLDPDADADADPDRVLERLDVGVG